MREILPLIRPSLGSTAITLDLDDAVPPLKADPGQIQQIIMNFAINAADAIGGPSGVVTIKTEVTEVDGAYIEQVLAKGQTQPGSYVCLEVHDTGVGMSAETQAKIFDPFFTTNFRAEGWVWPRCPASSGATREC